MALRIAGDRAAFYGCGFFGAQDTLHDDRGRHYYRGCFIQGSIDFIFGNARSLYQVDYLSLIKRYAIYHPNINSQNLLGLRGFKRDSVFIPRNAHKKSLTSINCCVWSIIW